MYQLPSVWYFVIKYKQTKTSEKQKLKIHTRHREGKRVTYWVSSWSQRPVFWNERSSQRRIRALLGCLSFFVFLHFQLIVHPSPPFQRRLRFGLGYLKRKKSSKTLSDLCQDRAASEVHCKRCLQKWLMSLPSNLCSWCLQLCIALESYGWLLSLVTRNQLFLLAIKQ